MPEDPGLFRGSVWLLAIAVAGVATATLAARFSARLLPLAALLKLSLAFPDRSPSRFRLAMKAPSSRRLGREVKQARSNGLSSDANTAAEQILLLTTAVGEHDRKTRGHSERVRFLSRLIGEELGLSEQDLDGAGYPKGLAGKDIPLAARIVAVADAFEVMTSVRAYKKPMSAEAARAELTRCAGSHFDPRIVRALLNVSVGPLRWATGPVALAMGLPLIGKFIGLLARAGFHIVGTPAAAAAIAPATATAGAMSVVAVTGSIPSRRPSHSRRPQSSNRSR